VENRRLGKSQAITFVIAFLSLLVGTLGVGVAPASAFLISDGGSFDVTWSDPANNIGATATFFVDIISSTHVLLEIKLTNTGTDATARLTGIGFNIEPDATAVGNPSESLGDPAGFAIFGTDTDQIDSSRTLLNDPSFGIIDICTDVDPSGACGSGPGGLTTGQVDAFVIDLTGTWGTSIDFPGPFTAKFASVGPTGGSFNLAGTPGGGGGPTEIPAPATLLLLGSGLLGLGLLGRRRK
jgi:PEP-CTERM motif